MRRFNEVTVMEAIRCHRPSTSDATIELNIFCINIGSIDTPDVVRACVRVCECRPNELGAVERTRRRVVQFYSNTISDFVVKRMQRDRACVCPRPSAYVDFFQCEKQSHISFVSMARTTLIFNSCFEHKIILNNKYLKKKAISC